MSSIEVKVKESEFKPANIILINDATSLKNQFVHILKVIQEQYNCLDDFLNSDIDRELEIVKIKGRYYIRFKR